MEVLNRQVFSHPAHLGCLLDNLARLCKQRVMPNPKPWPLFVLSLKERVKRPHSQAIVPLV